MSNYKVCINCGCSNLISDRSLAGKIVCAKCGSSSFKTKALNLPKKKYLIYLIIGILVLVIVII